MRCLEYLMSQLPRRIRGDFRVATDGLFMSMAPGRDQRLGLSHYHVYREEDHHVERDSAWNLHLIQLRGIYIQYDVYIVYA